MLEMIHSAGLRTIVISGKSGNTSPSAVRCTVCHEYELLSICLIILVSEALPPSGSVPVCWITQRLPLCVHFPSEKPPSESKTQERICLEFVSQPMICRPDKST